MSTLRYALLSSSCRRQSGHTSRSGASTSAGCTYIGSLRITGVASSTLQASSRSYIPCSDICAGASSRMTAARPCAPANAPCCGSEVSSAAAHDPHALSVRWRLGAGEHARSVTLPELCTALRLDGVAANVGACVRKNEATMRLPVSADGMRGGHKVVVKIWEGHIVRHRDAERIQLCHLHGAARIGSGMPAYELRAAHVRRNIWCGARDVRSPRSAAALVRHAPGSCSQQGSLGGV